MSPEEPSIQELSAQWPETDDSGNVDMTIIRHNLALTPAERIERHYYARMLVQRMREAGERFYGSPHPNPETAR